MNFEDEDVMLNQFVISHMDTKWIIESERKRHSKESRGPTEGWVSSKFDLGMPWQELQQTMVPDVNLTFGACCNNLKKLWRKFLIAGARGEPRGDIAYSINSLKAAMGLELSDFSSEGVNNDEFEESGQEGLISEEEFAARRDEEIEAAGGAIGTTDEDRQLQREEKTGEDDWWFS